MPQNLLGRPQKLLWHMLERRIKEMLSRRIISVTGCPGEMVWVENAAIEEERSVVDLVGDIAKLWDFL